MDWKRHLAEVIDRTCDDANPTFNCNRPFYLVTQNIEIFSDSYLIACDVFDRSSRTYRGSVRLPVEFHEKTLGLWSNAVAFYKLMAVSDAVYKTSNKKVSHGP